MENVLFVGNGINRISNEDYSWQNLMINLWKIINVEKDKNYKSNKPFPLEFEEIVINGKISGIKEIEIKEHICSLTKNLKHNEIHETISEMGFKNIITTNYDTTLETIIFNGNYNSYKREGKHSIKRKNYNNSTNIWHIHGEESDKDSLLLGYEQYGSYLERIIRYTKKESIVREDIQTKSYVNQNESWINLFFSKDIYILGLDLDYVEIDLWWLITFRQRLINNIEGKRKFIHNKIVYFINQEVYKNNKNRIDTLENMGLKIISIDLDGNWESFYLNALENIKNESTRGKLEIA